MKAKEKEKENGKERGGSAPQGGMKKRVQKSTTGKRCTRSRWRVWMEDRREQPQRVGNEERYTVGHGGLKVT
jgi:hypothetical protein